MSQQRLWLCGNSKPFAEIVFMEFDCNENVDNLLNAIEKIAKKDFDGHFTIMRFTTHWKCFFGTMELRVGGDAEWLSSIPGHPTLIEALENLDIDYRREKRYQPSYRVSSPPPWE
jgi:hypothetical protein